MDSKKITVKVMHSFFIDALKDVIDHHSDINKKPLDVDLSKPYPLHLRIYMYNCTNPTGGRPRDEYKLQLIVPNQKRGERGNFDTSDGRIVLLVAYAQIYLEPNEGVFVFFDALKHTDFSYSANLQVKASIINRALLEPISLGNKQTGEVIIAAQAAHIMAAIDKRLTV